MKTKVLLFSSLCTHYSGMVLFEYEMKSLWISFYGRVSSWHQRIYHLFWCTLYIRAIPEATTLGAVELKLKLFAFGGCFFQFPSLLYRNSIDFQ